MGGDIDILSGFQLDAMLKSTPPAWAGTAVGESFAIMGMLKSTPPAWAGTKRTALRLILSELKSTPPAWAGTALLQDLKSFILA